MEAETHGRRILVTGVADFAGAELVRRLEQDPAIEFVAGLDFREPRRAFERAEIITADLRSSGLKRLLEGVKPDTILHLQRLRSDHGVEGIEEMHEINVMGTINLAATVQTISAVRKFVLMSALHVYGADAMDPAVLTEETKPRMPAKTKYAGDLAEMESAANQLARRSRLILTCLRFADIIGAKVNNAISRYLRMPVVPTILGFDPRLQFCHEADAVDLLKLAALEDLQGLYNVAGDGVINLSRALRLGGRIQLPIAGAMMRPVIAVMHRIGLADIQPYHALLLRYGRVVDTTLLKKKFGYRPRYSTVEAVLDLYDKSHLQRPSWTEKEDLEGKPAAA